MTLGFFWWWTDPSTGKRKREKKEKPGKKGDERHSDRHQKRRDKKPKGNEWYPPSPCFGTVLLGKTLGDGGVADGGGFAFCSPKCLPQSGLSVHPPFFRRRAGSQPARPKTHSARRKAHCATCHPALPCRAFLCWKQCCGQCLLTYICSPWPLWCSAIFTEYGSAGPLWCASAVNSKRKAALDSGSENVPGHPLAGV